MAAYIQLSQTITYPAQAFDNQLDDVNSNTNTRVKCKMFPEELRPRLLRRRRLWMKL